MLLQLMRDGKAHLSDPAEKYVTELNAVRSRYPNAALVTLMQLALHTPGLDLEPIAANNKNPGRGGRRA
jgi:CubicO group peptidase (beta-lactamase class C family)